MSDGERVAFYLIGQCLVAPIDSILIIDEPEIHLHRVIQARLWDAIEQERPDCLFVYLTHDLEFAASRSLAQKIWLEKYEGGAWYWKLIPTEHEGLPEEVLLAILGSRKPVLFVEGQQGSLDKAIFARIYPKWTIMPREGCDKVIEATKAFRDLKDLHGIECFGIVDMDYRTPQQRAELLAKSVYVLDMQEMENLLLIEPVLQLVAEYVHRIHLTSDTPTQIVKKVKDYAFATLSEQASKLASLKTAWELEGKLHKIDRKAVGVAELEAARNTAAQFDVASIYADFEQQIQQIIDSADYSALLRLYNNKSLAKHNKVQLAFGTADKYTDFMKRLVSSNEGKPIVQALQAAAPQLPVPATAAPAAA